MLIGIIFLFVVIWIISTACKEENKEVQVRIIDQETGKETIEIRKEDGKSTAKEAAQATLAIIFGIPLALIILLLLFGAMN